MTKPSDQRQIRIREDAAPAAAATDIVVVDDVVDVVVDEILLSRLASNLDLVGCRSFVDRGGLRR